MRKGFIRSALRATGKWFRRLVAAFLIVLLVIYLIVISPLGQILLRKLAVSLLSGLFGAEVQIESVRTDFWSRVDVYGLVVRDSLNLVSLSRLRVRYFLPALIRKAIVLRQIRLDKGYLTLVREPNGRLAFFLPEADSARVESRPEGPQRPSRWRVSIGRVEVNDLGAQYVDQALRMKAVLSGLNLKGYFLKGDSLAFELLALKGTFDSPWWRGGFGEIEADGSLGSFGVSVTALRVRGEDASVTAAGFVPFHPEGRWNVSASVRGRLESVVVLGHVFPSGAPAGEVEGEVSWYGSLRSPRLNADLAVHHAVLAHRAIEDARILAHYEPDGKLRASANTHLLGGRTEIRLDGIVKDLLTSPAVGDYEVQVKVDSLPVDSLLMWAPYRFPLRGGMTGLNLWARGHGTGIPAEVVLQAHVAELVTADTSLPDIWAEARVESSAWRAECYWGANAVRADGRFLPTRRLRGIVNLDCSELDIIARVLSGPRVEGRIWGEAEIFGPFNRLQFGGQVRGREIVAWDSRVDTVWAAFRAGGGTFRVENSYLSAEGNLEKIAEVVRATGLSGTVRLAVRAEGSPADWRARGTVACRDLSYQEFRVDSLRGQFVFLGDSLHWADLRLWRDSLTLASRGDFLVSGKKWTVSMELSPRSALETGANGGALRGSLTVSGDSLRLAAHWRELFLPYLLPWYPNGPDVVGELSGELMVQGTLAAPRARASVEARGVRYREMGPVDVDAHADLDSSALRFDGTARLAEEADSIRFRGFLPVESDQGWKLSPRPDRPVLLEARSGDLDLSPLSRWFSSRFSLSGRVAFDIALHDSGTGWYQSGFVRLRGAGFGFSERELLIADLVGETTLSGSPESPEFRFRLSSGPVRIGDQGVDSTHWRGVGDLEGIRLAVGSVSASAGKVALRGWVPLRWDSTGVAAEEETLWVQLRQFPLTALDALVGEGTLRTGSVSGELTILWRTPLPAVAGALSFLGTELRVDNLQPPLRVERAAVRFSGDTLVVSQLSGTWGRGTLSAEGRAIFGETGLAFADFRAQARSLRFAMPDVLDVRVESADFRFRSERGASSLKGNVRLGETRFIRNIGFGDLVRSLRGVTAPPEKPNQFVQNLELDLVVRAPRRFVVDMNLAKLRADVEMAISGTAAAPRYTGSVSIVEGYIFYLDRKFEITRGVFRQYEPFRLNPEIDFEAVAEVVPYSAIETPTVYRVTLKLTGDLDSPKLTLESEPALSTTDIVSLLTLGRIRSQEEYAGEPGIGQILVERARAITGRQITGMAERRIERLLNLESVTIEGNIFQINQNWAPRVTITKRLAERLNLSYQTVVGYTNEQRIKISYRLTPILYLDGETDERGQAGIDLRARVRFK